LDLGFIYSEGAFSIEDGHSCKYTDDVFKVLFSVGGRLPHFLMEDSRSSLDLVKEQWCLMCDESDSTDFQILFSDGFPTYIYHLSESLQQTLQLNFGYIMGNSILVRPDGIIAWYGCIKNKQSQNALSSFFQQYK
jgi:hypothetical protein